MNPTSRPTLSSQTKLLIIVLFLIAMGYGLYKFSEALPPIVLAIILAYVLSPVVNWLQKKSGIRRGLAIVWVYLALLLFIAVILTLVIPVLVAQFSRLSLDVEFILEHGRTLLRREYNIGGFLIYGRDVWDQVAIALRSLLDPILNNTIVFLAGVFTSFIWLIFIIIISIYLIKDSAALGRWFKGLVPPPFQPDFSRMGIEINQIWGSFFRGQLLLALVVMCIITLEGFAIGLRFALVMGVLAGLLEFLPSVGHGIWLVIASMIALFGGSTWLPIPNWAFLLVLITCHIIFTQFDLNYLIPRIIGRSVSLPPMVVILGIVAGAYLVGVLGVALAAPSIASLRVIGRYLYALVFDQEPFLQDTYSPPLPPPNLSWKRTEGKRKTESASMDDPRQPAQNTPGNP